MLLASEEGHLENNDKLINALGFNHHRHAIRIKITIFKPIIADY
jgi:hypothetical protein